MRLIALACIASILAVTPAVRAEDPIDAAPEIVAVRPGFDGRYKTGVWTPVEVVLRGAGRELRGQLWLTVADGEGVASTVSTPKHQPCRVAPEGETRLRLLARFGRVDGTAAVRFVSQDGAVSQRTFSSSTEPTDVEFPSALGADRKLVLCFADSPIGLEDAAAATDPRPDRQPIVARLEGTAPALTDWLGYEGVDTIAVAADDPAIVAASMAAGDPRLAALDRWIRLGGRLLIVVDPRSNVLDRPDHPMSSFAPTGWKTAVKAPHTDSVTTARGFGRVTLLAVNPDKPPWGQTSSRGKYLAKLLDWPRHADETSSDARAATHLGFTDISGQLRSALDRFSGVSTVPFAVVVAVLLVYLVLIGPVDYWVLRRINRLSWTWITFPALLILFGAGAYFAAHHLKGTEIRLNQLDLVDVDVESGLVRGTHWDNLYSPRAETYTLSLENGLPKNRVSEPARPVFTWLGLPGSGLGGMDPKTANPSPWRVAYHFSPSLDRIRGLPMQTASTRSFTGRWVARWNGPDRAKIVRHDDEPGGRLANPLDVELKRCLLIYDHWVYDLGTVGPGEPISLGNLPERSELRTRLTDLQKVFNEKGDKMERRVTAYNLRSVDLFYILQMMMFFEHAGGRQYTHLTNEYQSFVDLSHLLGPNRAMLIAVADMPAATVCRDDVPLDDDANQRMTVFRFVFPVSESTSR